MTPRCLRLIIVAMIVAAVAACDDTPTEPSLNLAGTWAGTLTFVTAGVTVTDSVTATLSQSGSSVTGAWTSTGGTTGQLTLTAAADITGSTTISQTTITGLVCAASTSVTGPATSSRLELSLGALTPTGNCPWAANQQMVLTR